MTKSKARSRTARRPRTATQQPARSSSRRDSGKSWSVSGGASTADASSSRSDRHLFQQEIQSMMHAFGDVRHPSLESAEVIEEIVRNQIRHLVVQTADATNLRGGRLMNIDDVVFLLRHNKDKLKRVVRYLTYREIRQKAQKQMGVEEDDSTEIDAVKPLPAAGSRKRKMCFDFLSTPDNPSGKVEITDDDLDELTVDRMERAEKLTRCMDQAQYVEYSECRQINFHKKLNKFRDWLDCGSLTDMKPGAAVLELLGYLAYEIVGQLVDLSLLVKRDADGHNDPLSTDYVSVTEQASNRSSYGITPTFVTVPAAAPASPGPSPPSSPPSTPSTPSANPPSVASGTASVVQTPGEGVNGGEDKVIQTGNSGRPAKAKKKAKAKASLLPSAVFASADALQPWHVREAHRRYSHFIGPMSAYAPATKTSVLRQTLCC